MHSLIAILTSSILRLTFGIAQTSFLRPFGKSGRAERALHSLMIPQSLMAQYISGKKNASDARVTLILDTVREIGQDLIAV